MGRSYAKSAAEAYLQASQASEESLRDAAMQRRVGTGGKRGAHAVAMKRKRSRVSTAGYDQLVQRLAELGRTRPRSLKTILEARREASGA